MYEHQFKRYWEEGLQSYLDNYEKCLFEFRRRSGAAFQCSVRGRLSNQRGYDPRKGQVNGSEEKEGQTGQDSQELIHVHVSEADGELVEGEFRSNRSWSEPDKAGWKEKI